MRVLVTGGSGFIGTYVVNTLKRAGYTVRVLDLMPPRAVGVEYIMGSVLDPYQTSMAVYGCDAVIHLAALLGVKRTERKLLDCLDINIKGTIHVLDAALRERVSKVISASSSEVYGEQTIQPISETNPTYPKSVYAVSKLAAEQYCRAYHQHYGLNYQTVRFFNVYGPGQVAEFVLPRFVKAVLEGQAPVVYGSGEQVRCFSHIADIAEGIRLLLEADVESEEVFNLGNDTEPISMADLAWRVIELANVNLEPRFVSMGSSDRQADREIVARVPDLSKARSVLGYEPKVSLNDGIRELLRGGNIPASWFEPMMYQITRGQDDVARVAPTEEDHTVQPAVG
ncbi:MAG: NAD-dependent epimerase/dehydratase family protein [Phycisphaerae bacterium]|nr:NAD-dependent epimerase/dehydratase family protein [Phycisphaerae bacterium]